MRSAKTYARLWFREDDHGRHFLRGREWHLYVSVRERWHEVIAKGWWHIGAGSLTNHYELETALGGEDNMLQAGIVVPLVGRVHAGVRVPRQLVRSWIYERRDLITVRVGYVGRWLELLILSDEPMRDTGMDDYYRRKRERGESLDPWTRAALWPGWHLTLAPRLRDRLLGRMECTLKKGEAVAVTVPMPEGNYPGRAYTETRTWGRKRWPLTRRTRTDWWIDMDIAPPVPGKGENSWDIDDDGIYGTGGATLAEAIANVTRAALRDRERYGSRGWVPDAGWPAGVAR